jgi:RNA polymerase sigma-70 factor (ECF subfamily)
LNREEVNLLLDQLFDEWYPMLHRYAARLTGDAALGEDAVQEAFMALYREFARGRKIANPRAWLLCVTRREVHRQMRARLKAGQPETAEILELLSPPQDPVAGLEADEIARSLSCLSVREEEVLLMRLEAMKYQEIAAELGITANTVGTLILRAIRKLQARCGVAAPSPSLRPVKKGDARHALQ